MYANKIIAELSPYAVFFVDNEPFVLFFNEPSDHDEQKELHKKIWNSQIPVVIFCGSTTIKVFSGCKINKQTRLLCMVDEFLLDELDEDSPFSYWDITNQNFWAKHTKQFSGEKLNDHLLSNLADITDKLKNRYKVPFATKLVLRLIFIRYLVDRGVDLDYPGFSSDVHYSKEFLLYLLKNRGDLYALFSHLKGKFNGNLFVTDNEDSSESLTAEVYALLYDFFSANVETRTGQLSFFDLYDFNIIPVELISSIYEVLLGKEGQDKCNSFYIPKYLVDYILESSISSFVKENGPCKVLDPSCGSGIFLVESYRNMVEKELKGAQFTEDNELLQHILTENIYGVDINNDAIDVTVFSLYVAILDYKNPRTLKEFKLPNIKGKNLLVEDFFDEDALVSLLGINFSFILGNPPWGKGTQLQVNYCEKYNYKKYIQNNDTCRSFILRSKDFCNYDTQCCFILHSTLLYMQKEPSKRFRQFLLENTKISRIVELSAVRKLVFKNANAPAIIFSFKFSNKNAIDNRFEHVSMKRNIFFRLFNIIVVEKTDVKSVKQKLLRDNDWAWKTLVYGLTGDVDNIMRLRANYLSIGDSIKAQCPKLITGEGIMYIDGELRNTSQLLELKLPFLNSKNSIGHFSMNEENTSPFEKSRLHRPRNPNLFHSPYCLTMAGVDMSDYTMKASYSETDFIFPSSVYAIKGSLPQKTFLLNIVGLLNSKFYAYLNLMLSSSIGIERESRHMREVLSFPFVVDEAISTLVAEIQESKKGKNEFLVNNDFAESKIRKLNNLIFKAFGLSDDEFVDYALNIQIPQLTGVNDRIINREATIHDFEVYGRIFYNHFFEVFIRTNKYVQINIYPNVIRHYSAFEVVLLEQKPSDWLMVIDDNDNKQKKMFIKLSAHKINDLFYTLKDVLYFEDNTFYIIKPSCYKNWHPAIARIDLLEVIDKILSGNEEDENNVLLFTPHMKKRQCFNNIAELDMFAFQSIKISDQRSQQYS
jgi:hypothetical protein